MKMMNSSEETYYFIKKHPLNEIRLQKLIININSLRWHRGLIPLTMMTTHHLSRASYLANSDHGLILMLGANSDRGLLLMIGAFSDHGLLFLIYPT